MYWSRFIPYFFLRLCGVSFLYPNPLDDAVSGHFLFLELTGLNVCLRFRFFLLCFFPVALLLTDPVEFLLVRSH